MRSITMFHPKRLVFGNGSISQFLDDYVSLGRKRLLVVTAPQIGPLIAETLEALKKFGIRVALEDSVVTEPTIETLATALKTANDANIDSVVGIGGGSVLDVAKLVSALHHNKQRVQEVFGIGKLDGRKHYLACLPTTAGTGSEVSPNAILLDPADQLKKGVVSSHLVPDAAYVDPILTRTVPPAVTASTAMDALTHCIEAYTNRFAHPFIDLYALQGVRLIGSNLQQAYKNGSDSEARASLALGSLYGGMCLGPVNTAAVHALAYPLGGEFHVAHGLSNAILLPYVMEFNMSVAPDRYADIAVALGVKLGDTALATAQAGVESIRQIARECGMPEKLSELNIPQNAVTHMAKAALTVTRLLKNNVREITLDAAQRIYEQAF